MANCVVIDIDQSNKSSPLQERYKDQSFQNLVIPFIHKFPYLVDFVNLQDKKNLLAIIDSSGDPEKIHVTFNDDNELILSIHEGEFEKNISLFRKDLDILEKAIYFIEDSRHNETESYNLYSYDEDLRVDREFISEYLQRNDGDWGGVGDELLNDREYVLSNINQLKNTTCLRYLSSNLQSDREIVLAAVKRNGLELEHASSNLQSDREVVLEAIKQNGQAIRYVNSKELLSDKDLILTSLLTFSGAVLYSSFYNYDKDFIIQCIKVQPSCFNHYCEIRSDRDIALLAVKGDPTFLANASPEILNDREIIMEAIKKEPFSLCYARNGPLNADRELVMLAVTNLGYTLEFASQDLKADKEIVMAALRNHPAAWQYVDKNLLDSDREVALLAVRYVLAFEKLSDEFRGDREIALIAVSNDNRTFRYILNGLNSDREIATIAMTGDYLNYSFLGDDLKKDKSFLIPLINKNIHLLSVIDKSVIDKELVEATDSYEVAIQFASEEMKKELEKDRDVLKILKETGYGLELVDESLRNDRDFILSIVKVNGFALYYVNEEFKSDREIVLAAVSKNGEALEYVTDSSLQYDKEIIRAALKNLTG